MKKLLLLSSAAMLSIGALEAESSDALTVKVGNKTLTTQSAQFELNGPISVKLGNDQAVMCVGDVEVAVMELRHGGQMDITYEEYDAESNKLTANVSAAGYATFFSAFQLVKPAGLAVYAPALTEDGNLDLSSATSIATNAVIPAGTGLVLRGKPGSYKLDITTDEADDIVSALDGLLVEAPTAMISKRSAIYTLAQENGEVAFYRYEGETLAAGKAYLAMNSNLGRIDFEFDDEADALDVIEQTPAQQPEAYNVAGQRVKADSRGIVIVGGKKIINR